MSTVPRTVRKAAAASGAAANGAETVTSRGVAKSRTTPSAHSAAGSHRARRHSPPPRRRRPRSPAVSRPPFPARFQSDPLGSSGPVRSGRRGKEPGGTPEPGGPRRQPPWPAVPSPRSPTTDGAASPVESRRRTREGPAEDRETVGSAGRRSGSPDSGDREDGGGTPGTAAPQPSGLHVPAGNRAPPGGGPRPRPEHGRQTCGAGRPAGAWRPARAGRASAAGAGAEDSGPILGTDALPVLVTGPPDQSTRREPRSSGGVTLAALGVTVVTFVIFGLVKESGAQALLPGFNSTVLTFPSVRCGSKETCSPASLTKASPG